jgi:hypothetical protein
MMNLLTVAFAALLSTVSLTGAAPTTSTPKLHHGQLAGSIIPDHYIVVFKDSVTLSQGMYALFFFTKIPYKESYLNPVFL